MIRFPRYTQLRDSGTIHAVAYSPEERRMRIIFVRNHAVWDYLDVPPTEYASIVAAKSSGAVFNERVRGRYDSIPITINEETEGQRVAATKKRRGQLVMLDNYE